MQLVDFILNLPIGILELMLLLPIAGAFIAFIVGNKASRGVALLISTAELGLSLILALAYTPPTTAGDLGIRFNATYPIANLAGVGGSTLQFELGVDGISVVMVILANLVVWIAAISSNHIHESEKSYYFFFMLLQTGLLGVFVSMDLIGFFVFWELVLIPMFFIIGRWGEEGCQHAAIKFFIYTHLGSAVLIISFFALYFLAPEPTFSMIALRGMGLPQMVQVGFAIAVFVGAGVKLPVFPLHNWLPWAHVKAPTPGSVILAGILLKMGGYAFIRLGVWMVPEAFARLAPVFVIVAIFTCIYAAFTAMAQTDMKSLVAYTSINHMSWVLLAVSVGALAYGNASLASAANIAIQGAVFMMFSHGTIISVMFIMAGQLKYAAGTRQIPEIQGLMEKAPKMSSILILASFAAFGLPGFSGFIAEALILFGSVSIIIWAAIIGLGIFLTVGYMLWMLNRVVFSDPDPEKEITEAPRSDLIAPILMMIPVILLGLWPDLILYLINPIATVILGGVP